MIIKVDVREQGLLAQITNLVQNIPVFKHIQIVTESLPIGDIIILNDKDEKLIIERKSINDLLASIKDGRYEEQSYRLNGLPHHNHNIYYIIEGDINRINRFKNVELEKMTIYSAIFSLNYYKGFSVMRTFTIEETALFICNTTNKLCKSEKPSFYKNVIQSGNPDQKEQKDQKEEQKEQKEEEKEYVNVVKKVKKDNITEDNIGEIMLCQIPSVSSITAIAIMKKYNTI